jgi:sialic acid synthase SpsE/RimJ/RimL family protein N-acetyltransferase
MMEEEVKPRDAGEMKQPIHFEIMQNGEEECRMVWQWRNDADTRRNSFHSEVKEYATFRKEFDRYFCFTDLPPLFVRMGNKRVAVLHFAPYEDPLDDKRDSKRRSAEISINIAPGYRGQGLGRRCLKAVQPWIKQQGYEALVAEVKIENERSQKAFIGAGFKRLDNGSKVLFDTGEVMPMCRFLAQLQAPRERKPCFIVAEAGSNWRMGTPWRDRSMGKMLIDIAKEAGADAVKFQVFHPESLYVSNAGSSEYLKDAGISHAMEDLFEDLTLSEELIYEFHAYCQEVGIEFMATPFSKKDFHIIAPLVKRNKIASYELSHIHLLDLAAEAAKPLFLSTGAATAEEIGWSVDRYFLQGGKDLTLLQCTAAYPAPAEAMHLQAIQWLRKRFGCAVGLSDHSRHPTAAPVAAVALGATVIEKHYTMDNKLPGPDHAFALLPEELRDMVQAVRQAEAMQGSSVKGVDPVEKELRAFARRGLQAIVDIHAGEQLVEDVNFAILRSGAQPLGLHPRFLALVSGKRATHDIACGRGLTFGDIE